MSASEQGLFNTLSAEEQQQIELICNEVARARSSGEQVQYEAYLSRVGPALRDALLQELLRLDLEWSVARGDRNRLKELSTHYPQWVDLLSKWHEEAHISLHASLLSDEQCGTYAQSRSEPAPGRVPPMSADASAALPAIIGEYEILEQLGRGGMGVVHKAKHRRLGKLVAIKLLPAENIPGAQAMQRFQREMRAIGSLQHPNLIEAHDAGEHAGSLYLVMRYIEGMDLQSYVEQNGPMAPTEACRLIHQAALGLQSLHARDLVHRDVKPGNLMRAIDGQLVVIDLGLARWVADIDANANISGQRCTVGTPDYLAPEQVVSSTDVDHRADLYGLGGTLFYLLAGRPPFLHHPTVQAKLRAHLIGAPPDLRSLQPGIPLSLVEIVARLLAKKPQDRYPTAQALANDLERQIQSAPSSTTIPLPKHSAPQKKRPWKIIGIIGAVITACLLGVIIFNGNPGQPTAPDPQQPIKPGAVADSHPLVRKFEVHHMIKRTGREEPRGRLGEDSFITYLGDGATVDVVLSAPAYCYIVACSPTGGPDPAFPPDSTKPPPLTDKPAIPWKSVSGSFKLTNGTGLTGIYLLVSEQPLPSWEQWKKKLPSSPWKSMPGQSGVVWIYNQNGLTSKLSKSIRRVTHSGNMIEQMGKYLQQPGISKVEGIGFLVRSR